MEKILETDKNIWFINPGMDLGDDHEATVDGVHPTDLGFERMLKKVQPQIIRILQKHGIKTLYLDEKLDIKLLNENEYSEKTGFIGGCISRIKNKIIVFGDLDKIDFQNKIRSFIHERNLEVIEFKGLDVIDYGGLIEVG